MTRKDFERIAQVLRCNGNSLTDEQHDIWEAILDDMCVELKAINPRFNKETFIKACNQ